MRLKQYVIEQTAADKRGEFVANSISEFTEDETELMWTLVLELVMCKGLGEAIDAVSSAARVIRKQHPDEQTREKASNIEDALNKLSEEVGSSFGTR
jgi:hypothetical protein